MTPGTVVVEFRDFWPGFDPHRNFLLDALREVVEVEVGPPGDICFASVFGTTHLGFVGTKVQVIGENVRPDLRSADFAIAFDRTTDPRVLRYPQWAWDVDTTRLMRPTADNGAARPPDFCNFLASNPGNPVRNAMFEALTAVGFVHAGGAVFHNGEGPGPRSAVDWRTAKGAYLRRFRFTIAAESQAHPGYTTEKLVDAFLAGSVPIYWGDPTVTTDFNASAFLRLADAGTLAELVALVRAIERDPARYEAMRSEPAMPRSTWDRVANPERLSAFLEGVVAFHAPPSVLLARAVRGRARQVAAPALRLRPRLAASWRRAGGRGMGQGDGR